MFCLHLNFTARPPFKSLSTYRAFKRKVLNMDLHVFFEVFGSLKYFVTNTTFIDGCLGRFLFVSVVIMVI